MLYVLGYVLIGFLVATALLKFTNVASMDVKEDTGTFCIFWVIWPLVVLVFLIIGPLALLSRYVKFITAVKK